MIYFGHLKLSWPFRGHSGHAEPYWLYHKQHDNFGHSEWDCGQQIIPNQNAPSMDNMMRFGHAQANCPFYGQHDTFGSPQTMPMAFSGQTCLPYRLHCTQRLWSRSVSACRHPIAGTARSAVCSAKPRDIALCLPCSRLRGVFTDNSTGPSHYAESPGTTAHLSHTQPASWLKELQWTLACTTTGPRRSFTTVLQACPDSLASTWMYLFITINSLFVGLLWSLKYPWGSLKRNSTVPLRGFCFCTCLFSPWRVKHWPHSTLTSVVCFWSWLGFLRVSPHLRGAMRSEAAPLMSAMYTLCNLTLTLERPFDKSSENTYRRQLGLAGKYQVRLQCLIFTPKLD